MKNYPYEQTKLSLTDLRSAIKGEVISPGEPGYDKARTPFYGGIDRKPAAIARVRDASDIANVIRLARESGMELAVRSGGHSSAGHSVSDGGIVIDLTNMKKLEIDAKNRTAWVETGLTAGEYTDAAGAKGLATGFGDTGSVGIGGITLGGGVGYLVRKYGLTIDSLLAAEIVTADGSILHVDSESYPDLFWAIRGGGGNFGVATRFLYRLHEVDTVLGGMLILPASAEVFYKFMRETYDAPDELSLIANIMPAPPMPFLPPELHGKLILMAIIVYAGNVEEGQQALVPLRSVAKPLADMIRPMHYPEIYMPEEEGYAPTAVARTMHFDILDQAGAEAIIEFLEKSDAPMRVAQLRPLGGAMARVPVNETAYAHRQQKTMANLAAFYTSPEDKVQRVKWVNDFEAALYRGDSSVYVNFLDENGYKRIHDAYPDGTWERLQAIKTRYDPTNLFRLNQNISPAVER